MRIRLSTKLILGIVAIEAAMLALLVWNSTRIIEDSHTVLMERGLDQEVELLANALAPGLAAQDNALIKDTLSLLRKNEGYLYASVADYTGTHLAEYHSFIESNSGNDPVDHHLHPSLGDQTVTLNKDIMLSGQLLGQLHVDYSLAYVHAITGEARNQDLLISGLALATSIIATVLFATYLTKRLAKLQAGATALAMGNLQYRIDVSGSDELTDVATQFNDMAITLDHAHAELREKNHQLLVETAHLQTLLDGVDAVVLEADPETGQFNYVSNEASQLLGFTASEWSEKEFWFRHTHIDDIAGLKKILQNTSVVNGTSYTLDYRMRHKNGHYLWVRSINTVVKEEDTKPIIRGLILDITEEKKAEERIIYLADHDALTGLINRRRFQEELDHVMAMTKRYGYEGAVLFIDLDQFKYINDTLGHHGGDNYLITISQCIASTIRETDILGRLGGDEFGVILPRATEEEILTVTHKILKALNEHVQFAQDLRLQTSASIGIAIYPRHSSSVDDLLAKADTAMYVAKGRGRNGYNVYDDSEQQILLMRHKIQWEDRIRKALEEDHFRLFFQPIIDVQTEEIQHYEALIRMIDSETGEVIPPGAFLETAERFGLIREIDMWVVENALKQLVANQQHSPQIGYGINISGVNMGDSLFLEHIKTCIRRYQPNTAGIIFELTETAAMDNINKARQFVEELKAIGCRFSLDDFGVGFSSLHYLRNLPIDFIKIDGSFIRHLSGDKADQLMVKAICTIARGLGIQTVAECIEDKATLDLLKELDVDLGQGFYIGKPAARVLSITQQQASTP